MRIIEEPKKFSNFDDLKLGDVFNYDGVWYMKIDTIKSEMSVFNAVDLETGMLENIAPYSDVIYQDVELRVRDFQVLLNLILIMKFIKSCILVSLKLNISPYSNVNFILFYLGNAK